MCAVCRSADAFSVAGSYYSVDDDMGDDDVLMASNNAAAASQARREFKVKRSVSHEHLRDVGRDLSRESSEEAEGSDVMGLQLPSREYLHLPTNLWFSRLPLPAIPMIL